MTEKKIARGLLVILFGFFITIIFGSTYKIIEGVINKNDKDIRLYSIIVGITLFPIIIYILKLICNKYYLNKVEKAEKIQEINLTIEV